MTFKELLFKGMYFLGYKQGYETGKQEGLVFARLLQYYGKFEAIPTILLIKYCPSTKDELVANQILKQATMRLKYHIEACKLQGLEHTVNLIADYLEGNDLTDEQQQQMEILMKSPSRYGGVLVLASYLDDFNVEHFIDRMHHFGMYPAYQECMKNETHYIPITSPVPRHLEL